MNLQEIAVGFDAFEAAIAETGGVLTEELASQYDVLNLAEADKVTGYVLYLRDLEARAAAFDGKRAYYQNLADTEAAHKRAREADIAWHKARIKGYMEFRKVKKLEGTQGFGFRIQASGHAPVEIMVLTEDLPREWVEVTYTPKKDLIRAEIKAGRVDAAVARLGEVGFSVRIY